jgi:hypothetical protein
MNPRMTAALVILAFVVCSLLASLAYAEPAPVHERLLFERCPFQPPIDKQQVHQA